MNSSILSSALLVWAGASLQATTIDYNLVSLGGNQWKYTYTVENDTIAGAITDFLIYFPSLSSSDAFNYTLDSTITPTGWNGSLFAPSAVDLGGFAEWSGGSIPAGGSDGVFGVEFTYTGTERLGQQSFEVYDDNFNLLDSGSTSRAGAAVPEQTATMTFAVLALACLGGIKAYQTRKTAAHV
ncbi:MAG TPA: hypothetical protein VGR78_12165 [Verrucomicrobiae bacterium]|jgi:hypothetical protein|nr:hypothetical protein [Verrucomicrobiae bacterium]